MSGRVWIRRWRAKNADLSEFRSRFGETPFCAIDPGKTGASCLRSVNNCYWVHGLYGGEGNEKVAKASSLLGCRVVVTEAQYAKKNKRTALDISLGLGVLLGQIQAECQGNLNVVLVAPSTWQAHQREGAGVQLERGAGIALALKVANEHLGELAAYKALNTEHKEGAASAFGIHQWWSHVMGGS